MTISRLHIRTIARKSIELKPLVAQFETNNNIRNSKVFKYVPELLTYIAENYVNVKPFHTVIPEFFHSKLLQELIFNTNLKADVWYVKNFINPIAENLSLNTSMDKFEKKDWARKIWHSSSTEVMKNLSMQAAYNVYFLMKPMTNSTYFTETKKHFKAFHLIETASKMPDSVLKSLLTLNDPIPKTLKYLDTRQFTGISWYGDTPRYFPGFDTRFLKWEADKLVSLRTLPSLRIPYTNPKISLELFKIGYAHFSTSDKVKELAQVKSLSKQMFLVEKAKAGNRIELASYLASSKILPVEVAEEMFDLGMGYRKSFPIVAKNPTYRNRDLFSRELPERNDIASFEEFKQNVRVRLLATENSAELRYCLNKLYSKKILKRTITGMTDINERMMKELSEGFSNYDNTWFIEEVANSGYRNMLLDAKKRFWEEKAEWFKKSEPEYAEIFADPTITFSAKENMHTLLIQQYVKD